MVLNCQCFWQAHVCVSHNTHPGCVYEVASGEIMLCATVLYSSTSLNAHIKFLHASLSLPFKARVCEH